MKPVEGELIARFAEQFAYDRNGMSLKELQKFFQQYQPTVPPTWTTTKTDYFTQCLNSMSPRNQRQALYDLCDSPPTMRGRVPDSASRLELLKLLTAADGISPLGVTLSQLSLAGVRDDWFTAASRIDSNPAAAVTAARTLVEATCKTILVALGQVPDTSGDLARLVKQTRTALGIDAKQGASQNVHLLCSGLAQVVEGLSSLSNVAGDRHGLVGGAALEDEILAGFAVHSAGALCVFFVQFYREQARLKIRTP